LVHQPPFPLPVPFCKKISYPPSPNFYQFCISPLTALSVTPVRNGSNKLEHAVLIGYENSSWYDAVAAFLPKKDPHLDL
jgi:hypothetical protein